MGTTAGTAGVSVRGPRVERQDEVLTPEALELLAELHRRFGARRQDLLARRQERRAEAGHTGRLDFLPETGDIREDASWRVASAPADLSNRRVEITGPTERKMLVNAMNSGAQVWLADFEDANSPTWANMVGGQLNLSDAIERRVDFTTPRDAAGRSVHGLRPVLLPQRPPPARQGHSSRRSWPPSRWRRSSTSCATTPRAQRRPLGLHVQPDQDLPRPPRLRSARPQRADDDGPVHACLHRAAGHNLPPPRRLRRRRHGGLHPQPARPGGQRRRAGEGPRGQGAGGGRRLRRRLGGAPRPRARGQGGVRPGPERPAQPARPASRG